ncbi:hypothetical protein PGTUg99_031713 [Puccinia graminis f. sp. tritici]|uniref:Uncharacterized protein n=1 Tax=Puccinia graminis f. sp. tritici TaxID=56615 RepID=A0A5B0NJJ3_PUCGR|nr:hypothetical protein PGTUg99_031713 [Puccinia graminis f. sp. tritici]
MTPVTEMRHGHVAFSHILRNERAPVDRLFYDDEKFSSYAASGSGEDKKHARLREVLTANEDFLVMPIMGRKQINEDNLARRVDRTSLRGPYPKKPSKEEWPSLQIF